MIILTGAAGFIGSHVAQFYGKKHRLLLVDHPQHFRERPYLEMEQLSFQELATGISEKEQRHKIVDRAYFPKILKSIRPEAPANDAKAKEHVLIPRGEKIELVIHLGACTNTGETRKEFLDEWNVEYTKSIWNWCTQHKIPLVYASSGATYGNGDQGFSDTWETALKLKPMNLYGQSKQDFDLWAHAEMKAGRTPPKFYGLKFFNVYGSQDAHKGPMISPVLRGYRQIRDTGKCQLFRSHHPDYKDGEQTRDFIHVSDIVKLVDYFAQGKAESGLYNCGTGKARTFYDMMAAIFASMGKKMAVEWIDTPVQYRKAYQYFTEADMSRVYASGFQEIFLTLEAGVEQYVKWLLEHEPKPSQLLN